MNSSIKNIFSKLILISMGFMQYTIAKVSQLYTMKDNHLQISSYSKDLSNKIFKYNDMFQNTLSNKNGYPNYYNKYYLVNTTNFSLIGNNYIKNRTSDLYNYLHNTQIFDSQMYSNYIILPQVTKKISFIMNNVQNNFNSLILLLLNNNSNSICLPLYNIKLLQNKPITNKQNANKKMLQNNNSKSKNNNTKTLPCGKKISKNISPVKIQNKRNTSKKLSVTDMINKAEKRKNIPSGLLKAIGSIESRLKPYAINYNGRGYFFSNKQSALRFVNNLIRKGKTNFGIGCFQLHYKSHSRKFRSVSDMLEPSKNIEYAANLLRNLYKNYGSKWSNAVKYYHSSNPYFNSIYYSKVKNKFGRKI